MLKFFRKIRKSLIDSGSVRKYVVYAIGEIMLVVIGILIALQINNNSEAKKNDKRVQTILLEITKSLEVEIDEAEQGLEFYILKDSILTLAINDKLSKLDYYSNSYLSPRYALFNGFSLYVNRIAYDNLKSNIDKIPEKYAEVVQEITFLYEQDGPSLLGDQQELKDQIKQLESILVYEKQWYTEITKPALNEEIIDFYLNDPLYKNMLAQYVNHI